MVSQPYHCDRLTRNKIKKSIYVSLNYCVILVVQLFLAVEALEPLPQPTANRGRAKMYRPVIEMYFRPNDK